MATRSEVSDGRFSIRRILINVPGINDFEIGSDVEDCLPVLLRLDGLRKTYEPVELEGDLR